MKISNGLLIKINKKLEKTIDTVFIREHF